MIASLQGRLLLAVGVLVVAVAGAVAFGARRDVRRQFLAYETVSRGDQPDVPSSALARIQSHLDGACCAPAVMSLAVAELPRQALLLVFDADGRLLATAGAPLTNLIDLTARVGEGLLSIEATRVVDEGRQRIQLRVGSPGQAVRLADGRLGGWHVLVVPDATREARVAALFGGLDQGLLLLTLGIGAAGLVLTWVIASSALRPLADLRAAAAAFGEGALHQRVPVAGPREVADLARDFNSLASRLQEQHALRQAMAHDVAHELRTPLTAMRCRIERMRDGVTPPSDGLFDALHDDVRHLSRLVDDLQDAALAQAGELRLTRQALRLCDVAQDVVDSLGLGTTTTVRLDVPADLVVWADPMRLRQVLANLVDNARRHASPGASIAITARRTEAEIVVEVENTGSHIAPADLPRVFERFWRVDTARDRRTGGSGLGLAIVKHLVEAHGGRVQATSTADTVTVTFTLPALSPLYRFLSGRMSPRIDS